ncbi:ABC transporter permease, partial [Shinella sumterensis]
MAAITETSSETLVTPRASRRDLWLLAPGALWMLLFLVAPILMMVYVSFWTQTTFKIEPTLTL